MTTTLDLLDAAFKRVWPVPRLDRPPQARQHRPVKKPANLLEFAARAEKHERILVLGYASVWWQAYWHCERTEVVEPGAFADALRLHSLDFLINHDRTRRVGCGALGDVWAEEDEHGLLVAVAAQPGRDHGLISGVIEGRLTQMSFKLSVVPRPNYHETHGKHPTLSIRRARLAEVSAVEAPADNAATALCVHADRDGRFHMMELDSTPARRETMKRLIDVSGWIASS